MSFVESDLEETESNMMKTKKHKHIIDTDTNMYLATTTKKSKAKSLSIYQTQLPILLITSYVCDFFTQKLFINPFKCLKTNYFYQKRLVITKEFIVYI